MLTKEKIIQNRATFVNLLKSIDIPGADIDGLISFLDESDFFFAPASVKCHAAYDGGLCEHSLNTYRAITELAGYMEYLGEQKLADERKFDENSLKVVALLHVLGKVNYFTEYTKNVKDEDGKWNSVREFKIREPEDRELGNVAVNTFLIVSKFIPLNSDETSALINFNCGIDTGYANKDMCAILAKSSLTTLLHCADMMSCYLIEQRHEQDN